jgi:hypothetical protein
MFQKFNSSARRVVFCARDNAIREGSAYIEPHHIVIALRELHPEAFARLFSVQADAEAVRQDFRLNPNPSDIAHDPGKVRFGNRTKQVLVSATEEAEFCWRKWEQPHR